MLEPDEGKLSRPVLRAGGGSNSASLTRHPLLTAEVLAHDAPYSDHDRKNCEQADADVNGYQESKIVIRCDWWHTFSFPVIIAWRERGPCSESNPRMP